MKFLRVAWEFWILGYQITGILPYLLYTLEWITNLIMNLQFLLASSFWQEHWKESRLHNVFPELICNCSRQMGLQEMNIVMMIFHLTLIWMISISRKNSRETLERATTGRKRWFLLQKMSKLTTKRYVPSESKVFCGFIMCEQLINPMGVAESMNTTVGWLEHYECILEFTDKI